MKKIAIFNHKGGVSKTTTSFNIGWTLAKKGKKVLLVDADSQCNLTMYALGEEEFDTYYVDKPNDNIYHSLEPAFKSQPKMIEAANCIELRNNLFLLPGHLDFTENEVQLGISMQLSNAFGAMQNLPGAINYLVEKTAEKYEIDFVIFDMNPSLSAINQDIFANSDYFIIPCSPDLFSTMSIDSLKRVLPNWESWAENARCSFANADYKISQNTPKFLGYTINDFNLSNGRAQRSFEGFMSRISEKIVNDLVPALSAKNMTLETNIYREKYEMMRDESTGHNIDYQDFYCLGQISNFNKLIALSNEQSVPVFEVRLEHAEPGQRRTLDWFKYLYNAISERILRLVQ